MAIDLTRDGHIATVTMNRPDALNAFDDDQLHAMLDTFHTIRQAPEIRCVILTGAGARAFAAGADIKRMAEMGPQEGDHFARLGHAVADTIETLPQPVIAAVNGYAFGGGCELALACDLRLCSDNAVFAQPEVSLGIPPGWGGSQRLPRLIGPGLAAELIFTGRRVAAEEALRIGLVNAVYPAAELMSATRTLAEHIAANSPRAVRAAKAAISRAFAGKTIEGLAVERSLFAAAFATEDQKTGMRAFLAKSQPEFSGN